MFSLISIRCWGLAFVQLPYLQLLSEKFILKGFPFFFNGLRNISCSFDCGKGWGELSFFPFDFLDWYICAPGTLGRRSCALKWAFTYMLLSLQPLLLQHELSHGFFRILNVAFLLLRRKISCGCSWYDSQLLRNRALFSNHTFLNNLKEWKITSYLHYSQAIRERLDPLQLSLLYLSCGMKGYQPTRSLFLLASCEKKWGISYVVF